MRQVFHRKINNAIKDELSENLRQMYELNRASEAYWEEVGSEEFVKHYLNDRDKQQIDEILKEFNEEISEDPEELIKRVNKEKS